MPDNCNANFTRLTPRQQDATHFTHFSVDLDIALDVPFNATLKVSCAGRCAVEIWSHLHAKHCSQWILRVHTGARCQGDQLVQPPISP